MRGKHGVAAARSRQSEAEARAAADRQALADARTELAAARAETALLQTRLDQAETTADTAIATETVRLDALVTELADERDILDAAYTRTIAILAPALRADRTVMYTPEELGELRDLMGPDRYATFLGGRRAARRAVRYWQGHNITRELNQPARLE